MAGPASDTRATRARLLTRTAVGALTAGIGATIGSSTIYALPQDGHVTAGTASIDYPAATRLDITQQSTHAIIDWRSFDIAADETVRVFQPSPDASLLNRVIGGEGKSTILGSLSAQGRLTLVNPQGVTIGSGATINVGSLIATTIDIHNEDFLADRLDFSIPGDPGALVTNRGAITASEGGLVALVAPGVENSGTIRARLGHVALASVNTFTLDLYGDDLIHIGVDGEVMQALAEQGALVSNSGTIIADGGTVQLTAAAGAEVVETVINMDGVVRARSVGVENGEIVFHGGDTGIVNVAGTVDATGDNAGETGGTVTITGEKVGLLDGALVDSSGPAGGGTILVGGDYKGGGDTPTAEVTAVLPEAEIRADATDAGDGGKVIVWADDTARYYGDISARGGPNGGNGGFVETSGKRYLDAQGSVDAGASKGEGGTWLLDPTPVNIIDGASVFGSFDGPTWFVNAPAGETSQLNVGELYDTVANNNTQVEVLTESADNQVGNITWLATIEAPIFGPNAGGISLRADGSVFFETPIRLIKDGGEFTFEVEALFGDVQFNAPFELGGVVQNAQGQVIAQGGGFLSVNAPNGTFFTNFGAFVNVLGPIDVTVENIDLSGQVIAGDLNVNHPIPEESSIGIGNNTGFVDILIDNNELALLNLGALRLNSGFEVVLGDVTAAATAGIFSVEVLAQGATISAFGTGAYNGLSLFGDVQLSSITSLNVQSAAIIQDPGTIFSMPIGSSIAASNGLQIRADDVDIRGALAAGNNQEIRFVVTSAGNTRIGGLDPAGAVFHLDQNEIQNINIGSSTLTFGSLAVVASGSAFLNDFFFSGTTSVFAQSPGAGITVSGNVTTNANIVEGFSLGLFASGTVDIQDGTVDTSSNQRYISQTGVFFLGSTATLDLSGSGQGVLIGATDVFIDGLIDFGPSGTLGLLNTGAGTTVIGGAPQTEGDFAFTNTEAANVLGTVRNLAVGSGTQPVGDVNIGPFASFNNVNVNATGEVSILGDLNIGGLNIFTTGSTTIGADISTQNRLLIGSPTVTLTPQQAIRLGADGDIGITGTIDGAADLTLDAIGPVNLFGNVGDFVVLNSLNITGSSISVMDIATIGDLTFNPGAMAFFWFNYSSGQGSIDVNGPATLRQNASFRADGFVRFRDTVIGLNDGAQRLFARALGTVFVENGLGTVPGQRLSDIFLEGGTVILDGDTMTTADQQYAPNVLLVSGVLQAGGIICLETANIGVAPTGVVFDATSTLFGQGSGQVATFFARGESLDPYDLTFRGSVDGFSGLEVVNFGTNGGTLTFFDQIGQIQPLLDVDTDASLIHVLGGAVLSTASLDVEGAVTLAGTFTALEPGLGIRFQNTVNLAGDTIFNFGALDTDLVFSSTVDAMAGAVNPAFSIDLGNGSFFALDDIGATSPLGTFDLTAASASLNDVMTIGDQIYRASTGFSSTYTTGGGTFQVVGPTTLFADTTILTAGGDILFGPELTTAPMANSLFLDAGSGNILFGDVGPAETPLATLQIANADDVTITGSMFVTDFVQNTGTGTTSLGFASLHATNDIAIANGTITGFLEGDTVVLAASLLGTSADDPLIIFANSLSISAQQAFLSGLISGSSGSDAILSINLLTPLPLDANVFTFDGITFRSILFPQSSTPNTEIVRIIDNQLPNQVEIVIVEEEPESGTSDTGDTVTVGYEDDEFRVVDESELGDTADNDDEDDSAVDCQCQL